MKEKEDKLKLVKQILINDDEMSKNDRPESKETIHIQNDVEMPITSKITTTVPNTASESILITTTPKTTTKTVSAIKFEDCNDTRPSRKVNIIIVMILSYILKIKLYYLKSFIG